MDTSGPTHGGPDAGPPTTDSLQLVAAVAAVVVVVTLPLGADAAAVHADPGGLALVDVWWGGGRREGPQSVKAAVYFYRCSTDSSN